MNPTPISLPFSNGATIQVFVYPHKIYGVITGYNLIKRYGIRRKTSYNIILSDTKLLLPSGNLPTQIKFNGNSYNARYLLSRIEDILKIRIVHRSEDRVLKHLQNTTLNLPFSLLELPHLRK